MNDMSDENVLADFFQREGARHFEFSDIWHNVLPAVFSDVASYYDVASNVASLGMCKVWRRRFLSAIDVRPGDRVLDVCAGTNAVGIGLLERQRDLRMYAIDRSKAMQDVGQDFAKARGLNIESTISDVHVLPYPDDFFDVVSLQWASRHLRIVDVFTEVRRVLKPGGHFYHCDMLRPENAVVSVLYSLYLKACVSLTALMFSSGSEAWSCRNYFVRAIETFYSAQEISEMLSQLEFSNIRIETAAGGIMAIHGAQKRA